MLFTTYLGFVINVTVPVFVLIFLGLWLKANNKIDQSFVHQSSDLVFNIALPVLMFIAIAKTDLAKVALSDLLVVSLSVALLSFVLLYGLATWLLSDDDKPQLGVVVQGGFRSNLGIIGLALCINSQGEVGLLYGAVILAIVTPIYNVLSVYVLTQARLKDQGQGFEWLPLIWQVMKNPLIVAIMLALPLAWWQPKLPQVFWQSGEYLANLTLPLALIGIGASLDFSQLRDTRLLAWLAVLFKLIVVPALVLLMVFGLEAVLLGFDLSDEQLVCTIIMFSCPTAAASFVMVKKMGGDYVLAANIIALTTLLSMITIPVYLYLLTHFSILALN